MKLKRRRLRRGVYILPNLFTTANLFCGFFASIRAINGDFLMAAWMIVLAGIFDFIDGRVARLTGSSSEFGLEYDSLSDLTSFGLAPAILMYQWALFNFGRFGWAAAFLFFACGALRLARFNVQVADVEKKSFQGLPIPAAAYCLASYVIFYHHLFGGGTNESYFLVPLTFILALLMVSKIPYRSFKELDRRRRGQFIFLVLIVGAFFILLTAPQVVIFCLSLGYVAMGIVEEVLRSPRRIKGIKDFMIRYFHDAEEDLERDSDKPQQSLPLRVVGMEQAPETKHQSEEEKKNPGA